MQILEKINPIENLSKISTWITDVTQLSMPLLLAISCLSASTISADDPVLEIENSTEVSTSNYPASFFDKYLPQNAMEMIARLPGFNFDRGSNERGFGGNAGNVLIDGSRPTSKSAGLDASLVRIPATQVERIEIIRGGNSSGEAAGQSIVANVIRKKSVSSGSWAFKERWAPKGKPQSNLEAAISTTIGDWNTSFDIDIGASPGYRSADLTNVTAGGSLIWSAKEKLSEHNEFFFINGEGAKTIGDGKLTINARLGGNRYSQDMSRDIYNEREVDDTTRDVLWLLDSTNKYEVRELGVDWTQPLSGWNWRVIALGLQEAREFENHLNVQSENINDDVDFDNAFEQDTENSEYIFRSTFSKITDSAIKPEFGFELANNKLLSQSVFFQDAIQQTLNGGDVVVEEQRSEIFATAIFGVSDKLTIEGGLTTEFSKIEVSGETSEEQSFTFLKPRVSATYKFNNNQQITLEFERIVGQLDFNDFAASSQATDDRTTSGNPNLSPDKTTELALTYDWSFSERGSLKLKTFYQRKEDILEQIILPSGGQGIGNAGDAEFWGLLTDLNIPLDYILDNGLIEISHFYRDSDFTDPVINADRTINGYSHNWLTFTLRQDITKYKLAWGIVYWGGFKDINYFVDERVTFEGNKRLKFFIETSQFFGVKAQLEISHMNTGEYDRTRYIYDNDRSNVLSNIETSQRLRRPEIKVTFSKNF